MAGIGVERHLECLPSLTYERPGSSLCPTRRWSCNIKRR